MSGQARRRKPANAMERGCFVSGVEPLALENFALFLQNQLNFGPI